MSSMEQEVYYQLLIEVSSAKLEQKLHIVLNIPSHHIDECFEAGILQELKFMQGLVLESQSDDQLVGISTMLLEALYSSKKPNKFKRFYQALQISVSCNNGLVKLPDGGREHMLFCFLSEYYHKQNRPDSSPISFDSLMSDDLLASLLSMNILTEDDMTTLAKSNRKKDVTLLSVLIRKHNWPHQFITAMIQAGMLSQLDQILPSFQQFFESNFHSSLIDTRAKLISSKDERRAASSLIGEAVDLFFCLNHNNQVSTDVQSKQEQLPSPPLGACANGLVPTGENALALTDQQRKQPQRLRHDDEVMKLAALPLLSEPASKQPKLSEGLQDNDYGEEDEGADSRESRTLQMRVYQEELASSGVAGLNCVIIAPTGSGKTLVSIRIATARLLEDQTRTARVCFLADRKNLVEQQYAAFKAQLPMEFQDRIVCVTGGDGDRAPLGFLLRHHSVLIMSTQILLNSLKDKCEDGLNGDLTKFRLIIFDECHHCAKDHPSNKIMEFYFQCKEQKPSGSRLPQIVGLTASPGTGRAHRATDAEKHVLRLCASLDCHRMVTVRHCAASLQSHVINPDFRLHKTDRKERDPVRRCLDELMDRAEQGLAEACDRMGLAPLTPPPRNTFLYTNFCGELRSRLSARFVEAATVWRRLHHCNVATLLWSLFRCTDALAYIEEHLCDTNVTDRQPTCELDAQLRDLLNQNLLPQMRAHCSENPVAARHSPALAQLREILADQFKRQPDSRALVFVQQRCFTVAVKNFLDVESTELRMAGIRTGVITGANASSDSGGITQIGQSDLLSEFRRGSVKIIISTSVTEEGLDVQKCNTVVRFCHVTNEIAMVQSRGRGRAEGSVYHVIVPNEMSWLGEKERLNQARDAMMLEAVTKLSGLATKDFAQMVQVEQCLLRTEARQQLDRHTTVAEANRNSEFSVDCLECGIHLTKSDRLRLAQGCHRLALDAELLTNRLIARREFPSRSFIDYTVLGVALLCRHCGNHVANLCRFKELTFAEMKVQSVRFVNTKTGEKHGPIKQWKLVQRFLTEVEIANNDLIEWARLLPEIPQSLLNSE